MNSFSLIDVFIIMAIVYFVLSLFVFLIANFEYFSIKVDAFLGKKPREIHSGGNSSSNDDYEVVPSPIVGGQVDPDHLNDNAPSLSLGMEVMRIMQSDQELTGKLWDSTTYPILDQPVNVDKEVDSFIKSHIDHHDFEEKLEYNGEKVNFILPSSGWSGGDKNNTINRVTIKYMVPLDMMDKVYSQLLTKYKLSPFIHANGTKRDSQTNYSTYFDTLDFICFKRRILMESDRFSLRLRWYDEPTASGVFLEEKKPLFKEGQSGAGKVRVIVNQSQINHLFHMETKNIDSENNYGDLQDRISEWGEKLYPSVLVKYQRASFFGESGNVRITIDKDIKFTKCPLTFKECCHPFYEKSLTEGLVFKNFKFGIVEVKITLKDGGNYDAIPLDSSDYWIQQNIESKYGAIKIPNHLSKFGISSSLIHKELDGFLDNSFSKNYQYYQDL